MGWRKQDVADTILFVTTRQKKEMGQRVARARDSRGMTNESLARASGLSVKTVSRFINGKHEPREHTIKSLAKALAVSPQEIRGTPPAPLGLGAREDQVESGFSEFRGYVGKILGELADAREDRAAMRALIDQHSVLLADQSALIRELREVVAVLPAVKQLADLVEREEAAHPSVPGTGGAERVDLPVGEAGSRRRTG